MILVPLASVLYTLALVCFLIAAYYGFRLVRVTRRSRKMIMISHDGPKYVVNGLVILAVSQVFNLAQNYETSTIIAVVSQALLVGAAFMFASGLHSMYVVFRNQRIRSEIFSALGETEEEPKPTNEKWNEFR